MVFCVCTNNFVGRCHSRRSQAFVMVACEWSNTQVLESPVYTLDLFLAMPSNQQSAELRVYTRGAAISPSLAGGAGPVQRAGVERSWSLCAPSAAKLEGVGVVMTVITRFDASTEI